jgi:hypothetical protein
MTYIHNSIPSDSGGINIEPGEFGNFLLCALRQLVHAKE